MKTKEKGDQTSQQNSLYCVVHIRRAFMTMHMWKKERSPIRLLLVESQANDKIYI